jgi:hypothetical protein
MRETADWLRRNAMKAEAQRRRKHWDFLSMPDTRLKLEANE